MRAAFFSFLMLCVSAAAHAVLGRWLLSVFPRLPRRAVVVVLGSLTVAATVTRLLTLATHWEWMGELFAVTMAELLVVVFAALPLAVVLGAAKLAPAPSTPDNTAPQVGRRQVLEGVGGTTVLLGASSLMGWGSLVGRHAFEVDEVVVKIPGLPRALDGYTLAQISDIHVGVLMQERNIREGLACLASARADLVVLTGDMVDFDPRYIPLAARLLGEIHARDGVFAVLGNHDHYTGALAVRDALERAGIDVLMNTGRVVRPQDGGGFALLGVDDLRGRDAGGGPRLDLALRAVPDDRPRILLSHQPQTVDLWAGRVALQLSGHTHGGQFNPGFSPAGLMLPYVAGRYRVGGTTMWVNRGFGVVGPPARVGAPPEVTKVVLVAG